MTRDEWLAKFGSDADVDVPSADEIDALLELAGIAAHTSDRTAAPITCWMAAAAGLSPAQALALVRAIRDGT